MAIVQSGRFHVWSLTWHDVENKFKAQKTFFEDHMDPVGLPSGGSFKDLLEGYGLSRFKKLHKYNSFDLLVHLLEKPDEAKWQKFMFIFSLLHLDPGKFSNNEAVDEWMKGIGKLLPDEMAEKLKETDCPNFHNDCLYGRYECVSQNGIESIRQFVVIEHKALTLPGDPLGGRIGCCFNDDEKAKTQPGFQQGWNGFLRLYNYYQFLPYSYFVTAEGMKAKAYDGINLFDAMTSKAGGARRGAVDGQWDEIKELTDEKIHGLLDLLKKNHWPLPEPGYELEGVNGEIIASAELAWEELKIAFLMDNEVEHQDQFMGLGWKVFPLAEIFDEPEKYMHLGDAQGGLG